MGVVFFVTARGKLSKQITDAEFSIKNKLFLEHAIGPICVFRITKVFEKIIE